MNPASIFAFVSPWRRLSCIGCFLVAVAVAAPALAVDSTRVIENTAVTMFGQNQSDQALAYLEAQITAATPAAKDLAVAQELTRIAFVFHNRKDDRLAEFVASLACARAEPRMADAVLSVAHFSVCREQVLVCDLILGDVNRALGRVDLALRFIAQSTATPGFAQARDDLLQLRQRLVRRLKIQQRPTA